jgi:hypothetical protein
VDQIQLYKYWCPADMGPPDGLSLEAYQNNCSEQPGSDVGWLLRDLSTDQEITGLSPSADLPGYAGYHELQQDQTVGITETLPPDSGYGVPIIFCYQFERGNPDGQLYAESYDPENGVTWTPQVGIYLVCYFFNVQAEDEFGQIIIEKYWCPPGLAFVQAPTAEDMAGACQEEGSGATFELQGPEGDPQTWPPMSPEGGPPATAGWEEVPPGNYAIYETGLGEGWIYAVYCMEVNGTVKTIQDPQAQELVDGNGIVWSIQAGSTLYCYWFNQPPPEDENSVTVYKWDCEPGTEYGRELDYYQGALEDQETGPCETQHTNIPISLIDGNGEHPTTTQADGTEWDGVVLDQNGSFQITEQIPEGYGDPMVFCGTLDEETQTMVPATGGTISITPSAEPFTYQCNWYNIPEEDGYNYIDFYKYECTEAAPEGSDKTWYEENCTPVEGWQFDLLWTDGGGGGTTDASGYATFSGVPVGDWQATEALPEGYGQPVVWCRYVEWPDAVEATNDWVMFEAPDGVLGHGFEADGMRIECHWYNFPAQVYNYIDFYKYVCTEPAPEGSDKSWYEENCEPVEGWEFDLQWTDGGSTETTDASGYASWSGVPLGNWQGSETLPEGYGQPVVWCRYVEWPDEAAVTGDWQQSDAPDGILSGGFEFEGIRIECHWYNFAPEDYNYIDFYKYLCAPDALQDQDKTYYEENCEPVEGWEFDLQWTDGGSTETTDASGHAGWSGVPTGAWTGTETVPEGYGEPYVWCRYVEPEEGEWFGTGAPGGVYQGTFEFEGMRIECHWYNFGEPVEVADEPGNNWITIYKYLCPPGTVPGEELGGMQETCTESHSGVEFSVLGEGGGTPDVQTTVGGVVEWSDLEFGGYTVTETLPPGYGAPLVWCGYTMQDGVELEEANQQYDPYTVTDGAIQAQLENEPVRLVCYWFNFPGEETTVTVYKYNCDFHPEGYQTLGQWQEACPTEGDGWTFTLTDSEDNASEMVTASGSASWTDVPEGEFTLSETPQPGWGEPVVWCGWTAFIDGAIADAFPQQVETTGGEYTGEIVYPGTTYFCFWFNIPDDDSTVTVYKFICPEGQLEGVVPNPLQAYLEMCTTPGNGIEFTLETTQGESSATTLDGAANWYDVPQGEMTITETLPPGYDPPIWFCTRVGILDAVTTEGFESFVMNETEHSATIEEFGTRYICWVFNFPDPDRTVEVFKWLCPEGYTGESYEDWSSNCTMPMDNVKFTLTDDNGNWPLWTVGGHATWYGVAQGDVTLDEHIPPGYFEPVIYCSLEAVNGAAIAEDFTEYESTNGAITRELEYSEYHWVCHVFDIPKGPGEITFYKWLCPPGYDLYGWGANPQEDCELWDGVLFTLDQPVGPNQQSTTGDSIPGGVYFGDLDPGTYVATETVPPDIAYVFVLDCTGSDDDKVHPYPLQWGNILTIEVAGGDSIVCNWYNVPEPENGWVTVYKYQCWTPTFTSTVNCEIYEHGATFELFDWPDDDSYGVGTTNVGGLYTWYDLPEGAYDLDEISHKPCKITTTKHDGQGHIWVDTGQGTVVKVYNCKPKTPPPPGTPTVPGKPPVKYPNTGAGPGSAEIDAAMAQATPEGTPEGTPEASAEDYFLISCLDVPPGATPEATPETGDEPEPSPTPIGGEEEFDLPIDEEEEEEVATPDGGSPVPEEECVRGAIPERLVIDAAQVDAGVEILEIIDGVMEQPTGPELVTWYKETGRLGENNNVVIAAHVNYWGVPQGIFFYLDQLREGDRVEVTGDDGKIYVFEVEWVRQESNLAPPAAEVIGPTDVPSLTLITCGGEWNAQISEYDERTVARAVMVEVLDPPEEA